MKPGCELASRSQLGSEVGSTIAYLDKLVESSRVDERRIPADAGTSVTSWSIVMRTDVRASRKCQASAQFATASFRPLMTISICPEVNSGNMGNEMNWCAALSAIGNVSNLVFEALIGVLQMDRHRIVNATGNTHFGEQFNDLVSPRNTDRVDVIDVTGVIGHDRALQVPLFLAERRHTSRRANAGVHFPFQGAGVLLRARPPECRPFGVPADHRVMVFVDLAMIS